MAAIDLSFKGMGYAVYDLPPVCMKCGAEATVLEKRRFGRPNGQGATVEMPFCFRHVNHYRAQRLIGLAFKVAVPLCFVVTVGSGLGALTSKGNAWVFYTWQLLLAVAIVLMGLYWSLRTGVRLKSISENRIQFANVSPKFVQAVVEAEAKWLKALERGMGDRWHDRACRNSEEEPRYQRGRKEPHSQVADSEQDEADL
jgi:hypothetical protein